MPWHQGRSETIGNESEETELGVESSDGTFKRAQGTRGQPAHGGIAQLVEHLLCKQGVIGSNPFTSTKRW